MMPSLLRSKLFIPAMRPQWVTRPHLLRRLHEGIGGKLTLISAPAGFGKTTLLSEWVAQTGRQVAWFSLDEADNEEGRFLLYLVTALDAVIGGKLTDLTQTVPPPPAEAVLTALLNELNSTPNSILLVLDDYHVIDREAVDRTLVFLLEHLPPHHHMVISTREDPPLPLARLRARGQLTEVRAADLRFTSSEAAEFLNRIMGLMLSAQEVAALESRTEGWIAGLQLAALSIQGREDIDIFIKTFTGNHRYVVDYLIEEVLEQQPPAIRAFLLQTSILNRFTAPLCEAVTHQQGVTVLLETLERGNFFIIPLDDKRQWYRYHHLFADVLQSRLMAEQPDHVPLLHQRASEWFAREGSASDAIRHALAGNSFERAAEWVEAEWPALRRTRQEALLLGWLKSLPEAIIRRRPVLSVAYAHVLLASGVREGVAEWLLTAEQQLDTMAGNSVNHRKAEAWDREVLYHLPAEIEVARAGLALDRGDVAATAAHARKALELAPDDDLLTRGGAMGFLGLAHWTNGALQSAYENFAGGMANFQKSGNLPDITNGTIILASIRLAQGRLHQAMHLYEQAWQRATVEGVPMVRGAADLLVGMSELHRERNRLDTAVELLTQSKAMPEHLGFQQNRYRWHLAMARVLEAQGDTAGALNLLMEAERLYRADFSPNVRPISALMIRVKLTQGHIAEDVAWIRQSGLSVQDDPDYLREFEHLTLARVLLSNNQHQRTETSLLDVTRLLERLLQAAMDGERTGSIIEILVTQVLVHQARGDVPAALLSLTQALQLAQPEDYVRLFLDEGTPMQRLLETALKQNIAPEYVRLLLASFGAPPSPHNVTQPLIEPLSDREREVLRLLATDLSGPEIARTLVISLTTLRTHTQHIYEKLGVTNRRAAVTRAEALALL
jgi:LuxR family transcriptional regulator, maltose regulon positive regulatory protein